MDIDFDKLFAAADNKKFPTLQDNLSEHVHSVLMNAYHYAQTTVDAVYAYIQLSSDGHTHTHRVFFRIRGELYEAAALNDSPLKKKFNTSEEQQEKLAGFIGDDLDKAQKLFASGVQMRPSEIFASAEPRTDTERTELVYSFFGEPLPILEEAVAAWKERLLDPAPAIFGPEYPVVIEYEE